MEYVVEALKVFRNLVHAEKDQRCPKTGFYAASLIQTGVIKEFWELANIRACIKLFGKHAKNRV